VLATGFPPYTGVNLGITARLCWRITSSHSTRSDANGTINAFVIVPPNAVLGERWFIVAATPDNFVRKTSPAFTIASTASPITTPSLGFVIDNTDTPTTEGGFPGGWNVETGNGTAVRCSGRLTERIAGSL